MAGQVVMVSTNPADLDFFKKVAIQSRCSLDTSHNIDHLRRALVSRRDCSVVIDADSRGKLEETIQVSSRYVPSRRIFTVSDKADAFYSTLLTRGHPGQHLVRRYDKPALEVYSRLMAAAHLPELFEVGNLFSDKTKTQKLRIKRVSHKSAAVDGIQNVLNKLGIKDRLAALVAQAADELILNAIFDAPIVGDIRPLSYRPRHLEVELDDNEIVEIQLAANAQYMCLSVTDRFGSLPVLTAARALSQKAKEREKSGKTGLAGIFNSGLSLIMLSKPKVSTEMILVFPRVDNFKEFRNGFRFFSFIPDMPLPAKNH